jgi:HlyD family secretion protein
MIKKSIKILLGLALFGVFVWTFFFLYKKSEKPPVVYQTLSAFDTTIIKKTVATGSVIPRREVNMKSQVSGIVEKMYVIAGQEIKQGDVIAKVKIIPNMLNLANAENRVNQAQISFDNAKADYDRNAGLLKQQVIAQAEILPFELRVKTAKEELNAAENNLQLIKEGVTKSAGSATNTLIRSTITGMVLDVPIKEGSSVIESNTFNEGTTIASVANMGEMIFEGKVDESEVGKIKQGMELVLTIGAIDSESFKANLEYIAPKGVTENGAIQFLIRAALNSKTTGSFLRAGYSANADIILDRKDKVLAVPETVLQFEKDKTFIEVQTEGNTYEKRYLKTGLSDGVNIEVLEGVTKNEKIKVPEMNGMGSEISGG